LGLNEDISMEDLKKYYNKLLKIKLPDSGIENDELADVYFELAETDAYYAGLIATSIENNLSNKNDYNFVHLENIRKALVILNVNELSKEDKKIYSDCDSYLKILEELPGIISDKKQH